MKSDRKIFYMKKYVHKKLHLISTIYDLCDFFIILKCRRESRVFKCFRFCFDFFGKASLTCGASYNGAAWVATHLGLTEILSLTRLYLFLLILCLSLPLFFFPPSLSKPST
jgi:hypothetical protein